MKEYFSLQNLISHDRKAFNSLSANDKLSVSDRIYKYIPSFYLPSEESDETLVFESRFESGNL